MAKTKQYMDKLEAATAAAAATSSAAAAEPAVAPTDAADAGHEILARVATAQAAAFVPADERIVLSCAEGDVRVPLAALAHAGSLIAGNDLDAAEPVPIPPMVTLRAMVRRLLMLLLPLLLLLAQLLLRRLLLRESAAQRNRGRLSALPALCCFLGTQRLPFARNR